MMPKRPVVSWKDIVKLLYKQGYSFKRQKGSHMVFSIELSLRGHGIVSVPKHNELHPGTLNEILEIIS
jgi:predicted RNA binding protein YcfA (HicA-like mRNA interferase family)